MRVLGFDPGLRVSGYGALAHSAGGTALIEAGVIESKAGDPLELRLEDLYRGAVEVIAATEPTHVVIEELFSAYKNPLTAVVMGHARGVLCLAAAQAGLHVSTLGHSRVKRALVGSGSASKEQVARMVAAALGVNALPRPLDVSDALALALAFANVLEHERRYAAKPA